MDLPSVCKDSSSLKCSEAFNEVNVKGQSLHGAETRSHDPGGPALPGKVTGEIPCAWDQHTHIISPRTKKSPVAGATSTEPTFGNANLLLILFTVHFHESQTHEQVCYKGGT